MRVITYTYDDDAPPVGAEAIARILIPIAGHGKRKAGEEWHPVIFTAETAVEAYEKALAWWDAELEKERNRAAGLLKAQATRQAKAERVDGH